MVITLLSADALNHEESYAQEEWKLIQLRMQIEDNPTSFFKPFRINEMNMRDERLPHIFRDYIAREFNIEEIVKMTTDELGARS